MTVIELAVAIERLKNALESAEAAATEVNSPAFARVSNAYVAEVKLTLGSFERALAFRLETEDL